MSVFFANDVVFQGMFMIWETFMEFLHQIPVFFHHNHMLLGWEPRWDRVLNRDAHISTFRKAL